MAEENRIEELDRAVQMLLDGREAPAAPADPEIAALARVAAELRGLPREEFRAWLKADLERRGSMTSTAKASAMQVRTVIPYIVVQDVEGLLDFVKRAFEATEVLRTKGSAGGIHAEVRIGDTRIMMGGGGRGARQWRGTPMPTALHYYVSDADAVYRSALEAGAISMHEPVDQPYGDREASVKDAFGNRWYIATHQGKKYVPEGLGSVTPYLHPQGTERFLDFLERAFGAEVLGRYQTPEGTIAHARVRIGESMIEMGEAHGPWQPMPTMFNTVAADPDAAYQRALEAGAASLAPPADQPYGARVAAVTDPLGNQWYLSAPVKGA